MKGYKVRTLVRRARYSIVRWRHRPPSNVRAATHPPGYHWFGYYDMPCWDPSGRYLLSLSVDFQDRPPTAADVATIIMTDTKTGEHMCIATTRTFNWQQGCMLRWLDQDPPAILYNDREGDRLVTVKMNPFTGERRILGRANSDVSKAGDLALGLNFARIATTRPGYGYAGLPDPFAEELHPAQDGVFGIDLCKGEEWLAVSMQDVFDYLEHPESLQKTKMWFNHTLLNPSGTRFVFLVRWQTSAPSGWKTLMFSANPDGSNLKLVLRDGMVSHFDWRNDEELLVWTRINGHGDHFYLVNERTGAYEIVGPKYLTQDGHCSYSHNGRWILTDTYPDPKTLLRTLKVYIPDQDREVILGHFFSPPLFAGEIRCDLHPRWSPDDRRICFDSTHEGHRQVYVLDVPDLE